MTMNKSQRVKSFRDTIYRLNYKEHPVDILTFISDNAFLGNITKQGESIYPYWKKALVDIFSDKRKILVVFTGAQGGGKTTAACIALNYIQYLHLLLRDPWDYYSLAKSDKMTISFFNLNKSLGGSVGYRTLQNQMCSSSWFKDRANYVSTTKGDEYLQFPLLDYVLSSPNSKGGSIIGKHIIAGLLSEVDNPNISVGEKERVVQTYDDTLIRFKGRFAKDGYSLGKMFLDSSKQDELGFVDIFIEKEKANNAVIVFDAPTWEMTPENTYCGDKFLVAIGTAYKSSKIIQENEIEEYTKKNYRIIHVPIEYQEDFRRNIDKALRDIGGVSVGVARKTRLFSTEKFITDCFDPTKSDPVSEETIEIGLNDDRKLISYIELNKIRIPRDRARYISLDISFSHDACGIAMSGIKSWVNIMIQNPDGTYEKQPVPVVETDFILRLKAKESIPLHRIRELVFDLKANGFNIAEFSADLKLASEDTIQLLTKAGVKAEYFSVDTKNIPYTDFRNLVVDKRWVCHKHKMLYIELKHLQQIDEGKVDHPKEVKDIEIHEDGTVETFVLPGSKDLADCTCASVIRCMMNSAKPVDGELMQELLKKNSRETQSITEKLMPMRDSQGKEVVATRMSNGDIDTVNNLFTRIKRPDLKNFTTRE